MQNTAILTKCEDCFGILLYDLDEVPDFATLAQIIYIRILDADPQTCRRQQALYHLTKALENYKQVQSIELTEETKLLDLAPKQFWLEQWTTLQHQTSSLDWPDFSRPRWMTAGILVISALGANELSSNFQNYYQGLLFGFLVIFAPLLFFTTKYKTSLPYQIKTIADFLPYAETSPRIAWTLPQVISNLKQLAP